MALHVRTMYLNATFSEASETKYNRSPPQILWLEVADRVQGNQQVAVIDADGVHAVGAGAAADPVRLVVSLERGAGFCRSSRCVAVCHLITCVYLLLIVCPHTASRACT